MKRKSFSSIFSTKTLGIILFIILGVFSLNIKNVGAEILVEIKLNDKDEKFLMSSNSSPKGTSRNLLCTNYDITTDRTSVLLNCYYFKEIDRALTNQINTLVQEKILANQKKDAAKLQDLFKESYNSINNITDTSYSDSIQYLKDSLDWGMDLATKSYLSIYENLKSQPIVRRTVFSENQVDEIAKKLAQMYVYNAMTAYLTEGHTTLEQEKIPQEARDTALAIRESVGKSLSDSEKGAVRYNFYEVGFDVPTKYPNYIDNPGGEGDVGITNPDGNVDVTSGKASKASCTETSVWGIINNQNCSLVAFLINSILDGILFLIGGLVKLVGQLFDWVISFSIYNFNDWVTNSNAYHVWRNVILSLVTSLLLPLVFYMIIRMLIDNDTSRIKKILPRLLITALFVYFSFAIVGWIIDQTNVLSIYLYRSMHDPGQTLGDSLKRILAIDTAAVGIAKADWTTTLFQLIKVVINFVSLLVLIQGLVLIFMRAIILVLCLIFSPLMLLPAGINEYIDKYRDMVIKSFTNSAISAPIFMFIVLIALQIGEGIRNSLESNAQLNQIGQGLSGANVTMGATISSIIIIVVLQLAITVSKKMSGDIGGQISGKVGGFVGNLAFGGAAAVARGGVRAVSNNEKFQGWMKKNEGTSRGKLAASMMNTAKSSTFDMRNTTGFQKVSQVTTGDKGFFGKGSTRTIKNSQEAAYVKERAYHNSLTTEQGKKANLERLRKESGGGLYGKEIADRLEGRESGLSLKFFTLSERISHEKGYEIKFDKANEIKDENKRKDKLIGSIDEHYKDNKKGDKYFTEALEKPENIKLKKDFEEANKKENTAERKSAVMKTVEDFEKEEKARAKKEKEEKKKKEEEQKNEKKGEANLREEIKSGETKEGLKEKTFTSTPSSTSDKEVLKKMDNISRNTEETKHQLINMNKSVTSLIDSMRNKNTKTSADIPEEYVGTSPSLRNRQMYKRNEKGEFMNLNEEQKAQSKQQRETLNKNTKTSADIPEEYVGTSSSLRNRQMYKRNEKGEFMNLNEKQKAQSKQQRETLNKKTETTAPEPKNTLDQAA